MQGKGAPLPLHSIPKTNNNTNTKNKNKTKTNRKIKVVYTEDLTEPLFMRSTFTVVVWT
jgi:hypothetical protein